MPAAIGEGAFWQALTKSTDNPSSDPTTIQRMGASFT
jgi:hypothetical protein